MHTWKVLLVGVFAVACLALATATFIVPFSYEGTERWFWMAGLLVGTLGMAVLFALFLRHAGNSLDVKPRGVRP